MAEYVHGGADPACSSRPTPCVAVGSASRFSRASSLQLRCASRVGRKKLVVPAVGRAAESCACQTPLGRASLAWLERRDAARGETSASHGATHSVRKGKRTRVLTGRRAQQTARRCQRFLPTLQVRSCTSLRRCPVGEGRPSGRNHKQRLQRRAWVAKKGSPTPGSPCLSLRRHARPRNSAPSKPPVLHGD